jgi:Fe-S cluster assembly protein SufD
VPTTRDEEWRFTDLTPLTRACSCVRRSASARSPTATPFVPEAARGSFSSTAFMRPRCRDRTRMARGVTWPARRSARNRRAALEPISRSSRLRENVFGALNTAHLRDGAVVIVREGRGVREARALLYLATQAGRRRIPRCLVIAESGCELHVIEEYRALRRRLSSRTP